MRQNRRPVHRFRISSAINIIVHFLARSDLKPLSKPLLAGIRFRKRNQPVQPNLAPTAHPEPPIGPYQVQHPEAMGELLLFVPRSIESHLIDQTTGGYGYSHVAIDCGEVDLVTGQRVMIESTVRNPVWRARQDRYGKRAYVRIPLRDLGVEPSNFCACVKSRLGEQYDDLEALTWGAVDDPAKQICSDLAADCLPPDVLAGIAEAYRSNQLRRNSVSIHLHKGGVISVFVSPNGFGEFFGAPPGQKVHQPGERIIPQNTQCRREPQAARAIRPASILLFAVAGIVVAGLVSWTLIQRAERINRGKKDQVSPPTGRCRAQTAPNRPVVGVVFPSPAPGEGKNTQLQN